MKNNNEHPIIYKPSYGSEEDISFLKPMEWYWVKNRGCWRGPMQWQNTEFEEGQDKWGFWYPGYVGDIESVNFSLSCIDSNSIRSGVIQIERPSDDTAGWND